MNVESVAVDIGDVAYRRVFEKHWDDVFRFLLAWTNDPAAAEDLAQEAFVRLWLHRAALDWERPVLPWLLVTGRRLATDRFRALRRRLVVRTAAPMFDELGRVRWLDVQARLAALSALERTTLLMTAVEGWSYAELADATGTTDGALRAAVSRARRKLEVTE